MCRTGVHANVALVDNLPADMILGRDMPVLTDLLIADVNVDHDVNTMSKLI